MSIRMRDIMTGMRRRTFLRAVSGFAVAAPAAARQASAGEGIRLGLDTYSIRDFRWKALRLLDYAAGLKLDTIQISSLGEYESLEPAHLQKVRDHAARLRIVIDAGIGCVCPKSKGWNPRSGDPARYILRGLQVAKAVGATSMRCFMGGVEDRASQPVEALMEATIEIFRSVRSQALDLGVKIAIENHGDMQAREMKTLIEESGKDFVAACLDTGNPISVIEDPLLTLEVLGPYTVTSHVRDTALCEHPRGAAGQWVAMGDGSIDWRPFFQRYRELCPNAGVQLEIITGRAPRIFPYLEPDFWKSYPKTPASDFARFVALAKSGRPFMGAMLVAGSGPHPPEYRAALREQQRIDLERSVDYCRKVLGLGVNGRA